jgi:hypothetical protein
MSAALKIALALAAFAQSVIAFAPATRLAALHTAVAEHQMVRHSYDYQAYSPGDNGGIMGGAVVDYLSGPTEFIDGSIVHHNSLIERLPEQRLISTIDAILKEMELRNCRSDCIRQENRLRKKDGEIYNSREDVKK